MTSTTSLHNQTIGTVLAHSSAYTLGMIYLGIEIAVQCYVLFLMMYRNRRDAKLGLPLNPTRLTILTVAGFLGVIGIAMFINYPIHYGVLAVNIILALATWGYAWSVRRMLRG